MADLRPQPGFQEALRAHGEANWRDALLATRLLAAGGPVMGGIWIKARAGGVRDCYLEHLRTVVRPDKPWLRLPANASVSWLLDSVDLAASAMAGFMVRKKGLLNAVRGGVLLIPMAERIDQTCAAVIANALDQSREHDFLVIALDEAVDDDESLPAALAERLALKVDLHSTAWTAAQQGHTVAMADPAARIIDARLGKELFELVSNITLATGHASLRSLMHVANASRIVASLHERLDVGEEDAICALRLCLGIQLTAPDRSAQQEPDPPAPEHGEPTNRPEDQRAQPPESAEREQQSQHDTPVNLNQLTELLAAVEKGVIGDIPAFLSGERFRAKSGKAGKAGSMQKDARRGRPFGLAQSPPYPEARPDVIATLRAAAPWQRIRQAQRQRLAERGETSNMQPAASQKLLITREDYRYQRLRHQAPSTAIFMVDASGSTALERLGETKGAIEQLLARCYVRRDEVALIAFRGTTAETVLPPTRSLVAAKRKLAGLLGGGPTPLVSGLEQGLQMALALRRRGTTPILVLMTDGSGNVALDGSPDRALAAEQLMIMARKYRALEIRSICIDIARRPREAVTRLAAEMGADLHVLPRADARRMADLVNASMEAQGS
ncbi:VWA domain-containing protein [Peteryoungia desertarenae]|uniref:VWA domain-containing protein n=1 Tax=Peteryoungia desertarenae TaxID=1813451 RepID=A0ABX6QJK2_9HYPH|nr:VWA domain-containing protein [Peteryoungia desertarenae]QLF68467.1 VWA domain-containing protein [Peteryoungia desertarenae]